MTVIVTPPSASDDVQYLPRESEPNETCHRQARLPDLQNIGTEVKEITLRIRG